MTIDPLTIIHGDALSSLRTLESESVQTCVTSPPYWGLRSYGTEPLVWDNHNGCDHEWGAQIPGSNRGGSGTPTDKNNRGEGYGRDAERGGFCECGAWRGELGLEPTPDLYVQHLVEIFRELKRVLHGHGTLWLNLGDSYCGYWGDAKAVAEGRQSSADTNGWTNGFSMNSRPKYETLKSTGLKPKDLVGIPWMVAFALRADGWYLRSDIIWSKPNPMPESVTDRPTRSHEYVFLLSKSQRYFYDHEAIKEPATMALSEPDGNGSTVTGGAHGRHVLAEAIPLKERRTDKQRGHPRRHAGFNDRWDAMERTEQCSGMRNKRSVWEIATRPFPDAHFATFPIEIPTIGILAGSKPGDIVLDPFAGSGTTGKVAIELGRKAILIEPKAEYVEMIKRRCQTTIGLPL